MCALSVASDVFYPEGSSELWQYLAKNDLGWAFQRADAKSQWLWKTATVHSGVTLLFSVLTSTG